MDTRSIMSTTNDKQRNRCTEAVRLGIFSAKENAVPGIVLWVFATALVIGYYFIPGITAGLLALGNLKEKSGYLYSALATGLFGGIIPFLWRYTSYRRAKHNGKITTKLWNVPAWKAGVFLALFWSWKGIEIDFLYRMQSNIFGSGTDVQILLPKVLVDQFLYNPLWAGWTQIIAYWLLENGFKKNAITDPALWRTIGPRLITILISTWGVWIPMVTIIYSMPQNLQVPLFNIALCFWGLMLASLTKEKTEQPGTSG